MQTSTRLQARAGADPTMDPAGFCALRVAQVVRETADAVSLVFDIPPALAELFHYQAGQFVTVAVDVDGTEYRRCYSMSSSPATGQDLRITVKRDRDGVVSNFLNDAVSPGDQLRAARPEGRFVLHDRDIPIIAFAGGSGITPVYSLIGTALACTARTARLFYANRDVDSVIFQDGLTKLASAHRDRLRVHHHLDAQHGLVSDEHIAEQVAGAGDADYYICGPGPFMDTVEAALAANGVPRQRVHLERFTVAAPTPAPVADAVVTEEITIELNRKSITVPYRAGNTLLQTARMAGLKAPSSCETGSCGTCMARVVDGSARMLNNDALDDDEVADGWVVTCQALPTSPTVRVVYE